MRPARRRRDCVRDLELQAGDADATIGAPTHRRRPWRPRASVSETAPFVVRSVDLAGAERGEAHVDAAVRRCGRRRHRASASAWISPFVVTAVVFPDSAVSENPAVGRRDAHHRVSRHAHVVAHLEADADQEAARSFAFDGYASRSDVFFDDDACDSRSRATASVAARAIRSARTSTVDPVTPSISTIPLVLPICSSPAVSERVAPRPFVGGTPGKVPKTRRTQRGPARAARRTHRLPVHVRS